VAGDNGVAGDLAPDRAAEAWRSDPELVTIQDQHTEENRAKDQGNLT